jgi:hypothetical protein
MEDALADYIFNNYSQFYTDSESKAIRHHFGQVKFQHWPGDSPDIIKKEIESFKTVDQEALQLLKNGYAHFIRNTAERIYGEHKAELKLNLCPNCQRIARTPQAKQCRFCRHDWH